MYFVESLLDPSWTALQIETGIGQCLLLLSVTLALRHELRLPACDNLVQKRLGIKAVQALGKAVGPGKLPSSLALRAGKTGL